MIENYNPLADLWHSANRAQSIHGYFPVNITFGFAERPFISYNILGGIKSYFNRKTTRNTIRNIKLEISNRI